MTNVITILILLFLSPANGDIRNYLNSTKTYSIYHTEDLLYCATSGGVAILNMSTGSFDRITTGYGLLGIDVRDVTFDNYGNLWFICYDKGISILSPNNIWKELSGDWYNVPDSLFCINIINDTVLLGTNDGIRLWDITSENPMVKTDGMIRISSLLGDIVNDIRSLRDTIYICTDDGLGRATLSNITNASAWDVVVDTGNVKAAEYMGDTLWIALSEGIAYIADGIYHDAAEYDSRDLATWNGKLWIATTSGLIFWDGTGFPFISPRKDSRCLLPLTNLWVGTWDSGVMEYSQDTVKIYVPDGPGDNIFGDIDLDSAGNLWSINGSNLVSKYDVEDDKWEIFNKNNEWNVPPRVWLSALAIDDNGMIWLGVWNWWDYGPGIIRLFPDGSLDTTFRLPGNNVISEIQVGANNDVWISTWKFESYPTLLYRFRNGIIDSVTVFTFPPGINRITFDNQGNTWVGCTYLLGGGVYKIINEYDAYELPCPDIQGEEISSLAFDLDDRLWVGTPAGTYVVRDETIETVLTRNDESVVGDNAADILVDNQGNVWLLLEPIQGITKGGVTKITSNFEFSAITTDDGLVSNEISGQYDGLAYDETRGWLWIATGEGISRYETGYEPVQEAFTVQVYPNPFIRTENDSIIFKSPGSTMDRIIIYSISGRKIEELNRKSSNKVSWGVPPSLSSGVYIYVAYSGKGGKRLGKFSIVN